MQNTLYSNEFKDAERAVEDILESIYCKQCESGDYCEVPTAKEIVYAVLNAIGVEY